jgi:hypothetical protein
MPACLNCQQPLPALANFCAHCGQKASTRRLQLRDIAHEGWHALTHTDHSVLALVRGLLLQPGRIAADYVEGRRKRWFNPFVFLFVIVGLASVAMAGSGFVNFVRPGMDNPVTRFLQTHLNLIILMQVPLLALAGRLVFPRTERNVAEWLVLAAYTSGLRSVFFSLVVAPLWWLLSRFGMAPRSGWVVSVYLLLWVAYFAWAAAQFLRPDWRWPQLLRAVLVPVLAQGVSSLLISIAIGFAQQAR